jgi:DMSO/TMAO reductase YedYZ molybdopterin-dependent catalytic subunit
VDRRTLLARSGRLAALGLSLSALPPWLRDAAAAGASPFLERNAWPEHWETRLPFLGTADRTANDAFFVRSHFPVPEPAAASWKLEVTGLVRNPLALDLAALRALPPTARRATLECAGNGRGLFALATTSGTQWGRGAVGTAEWRGPALAALLDRADLRPEARYLWFEARDHATLPQAPPFLRSVQIQLARERGLIALQMNGSPLPTLHGGPARFVLPGWYGMAWTKWLTRIRVEATPSDNHFMAKGYRYVAPGGDPTMSPPVEAMRVKSVIVSPSEDARVAAGQAVVRGFAWTGGGRGTIRAVDVSGDGGRTWSTAALEGAQAPFAWQGFRAQVRVRPGADAGVMARATDDSGEVQPLEAQVNASGYGNNSIHRVRVRA